MGTAVMIIKLMPESPSADLSAIKKAAESAMTEEGAQGISFEERPIAFGLVAILMKFALDESKGTDLVEEKLSEIPSVSSVTIEDYRRAFG